MKKGKCSGGSCTCENCLKDRIRGLESMGFTTTAATKYLESMNRLGIKDEE